MLGSGKGFRCCCSSCCYQSPRGWRKQGTLLSRDLSIRICHSRFICRIYACQEHEPGCLFLSRQCHPVGCAQHSSLSQPHRAGAGAAAQLPRYSWQRDPYPGSTGVAGDHLQPGRAPHYLLPLIPPLLPAGKLGEDTMM